MKPKKILFVCKYNRFRSRVAETYFKKINRNKGIKVQSAGLIKGYLPLDKSQIAAAGEYGIKLSGKPRTMSMDFLDKQDKIIVVANDIPKIVFNYPSYKKKVVIWKIPDNLGSSVEKDKKIVRSIMKKVSQLNKKLEKEK
ncbi:hypothetical protein HYT25_00590 [Candidatus Pacearchaeota archaeon]|nr:hypothetical protein [Candidatus Pacearchaeota archaeon]